MTVNGEEEDLRKRLKVATLDADQPLFVSGPLKQTGRVMVKDENVCVHCGLCAERCPTAAWDMQKSTFRVPYASDEAADIDSWKSYKKAG
jgi:NAD-dependent dihydropyrimidine dehydrogenase PreA subunit